MCVSCQLSLSPLLHFVLKFSIQKIKGGEKTSERARRGRKERKVPSWISSRAPLPISRADISHKKRRRVRKRTFLKRGRKSRNLYLRDPLWRHAFLHTLARSHSVACLPACLPHLLCYFVSSQTVTVMLG